MRVRVLSRVYPLVDFALIPFVLVSAVILKFYRRIGSRKFRRLTWLLRRIGVFPIINHYYEPLFDNRLLSGNAAQERNLPGLRFSEIDQLEFISKFKFTNELVEMDLSRQGSPIHGFRLGNGSFESGDAEVLYQMIRTMKPNRIIEIGSGYSTLIANEALKRNEMETGLSFSHICIEPYEKQWLEKLADVTVIRNLVQDTGISWQNSLESGDLLFIDSSHIIRPQGDVLYEYLEVIPSLREGVIVHVHDIFSPRDYLPEWANMDVKFWNEQYLLEALLGCEHRYEVIVALNWLKHKNFEALNEVAPYLTPEREPGSIYFRIRS